MAAAPVIATPSGAALRLLLPWLLLPWLLLLLWLLLLPWLLLLWIQLPRLLHHQELLCDCRSRGCCSADNHMVSAAEADPHVAASPFFATPVDTAAPVVAATPAAASTVAAAFVAAVASGPMAVAPSVTVTK